MSRDPGPLTGTITAFFLFDVAEAIDLTAIGRLFRSTAPTRLAPKPPAPPYMQYQRPPILVEGAAAGLADIGGFTVRLKVFDYGVVSIALTVVAEHGTAIAQLLRGEREPLSAQERGEVMRHVISYLASDLVVPTWNAAFVYDSEAGVQGALEILEYANSQLLEFRYYDTLLDSRPARNVSTTVGASLH